MSLYFSFSRSVGLVVFFMLGGFFESKRSVIFGVVKWGGNRDIKEILMHQ